MADSMDVAIQLITSQLQTYVKDKNIDVSFLMILVPQLVKQAQSIVGLSGPERKIAIVQAATNLSASYTGAHAPELKQFVGILPTMLDVVVFSANKLTLKQVEAASSGCMSCFSALFKKPSEATPAKYEANVATVPVVVVKQEAVDSKTIEL